MNDDKVKSYLPRFNKLKQLDPKPYSLRGNLMLVEKLPEPELKTRGGIVLGGIIDNGSKQINGLGADIPQFCRILDIGEGYTDDDGNVIPNSMSVQPGDIVLINRLSIKYFSLFHTFFDYKPDQIGLARDNDIQMHFKGDEGLAKYFETLNKLEE